MEMMDLVMDGRFHSDVGRLGCAVKGNEPAFINRLPPVGVLRFISHKPSTPSASVPVIGPVFGSVL